MTDAKKGSHVSLREVRSLISEDDEAISYYTRIIESSICFDIISPMLKEILKEITKQPIIVIPDLTPAGGWAKPRESRRIYALDCRPLELGSPAGGLAQPALKLGNDNEG